MDGPLPFKSNTLCKANVLSVTKANSSWTKAGAQMVIARARQKNSQKDWNFASWTLTIK